MQIRIRSYSFNITEPFQAGTVISKAEAQALCDLRAENIQNNTRRWVAELTDSLAPGQLLPQATLDALQARITEYDLQYQFGEKSSSRPRIGELEKVARQVARERLEAAGAQPDLEGYEDLVDEQSKLPAVMEEARERVAATRKVLSEGLAGL